MGVAATMAGFGGVVASKAEEVAAVMTGLVEGVGARPGMDLLVAMMAQWGARGG